MAIQKSITDDAGVTHAEAYVVVTSITLKAAVSDPNKIVSIGVSVYHNAAARSKDDPSATKATIYVANTRPNALDIATYFADTVLDDTDKSPLKQAYTWLKTKNNVFEIDWTTGTTDV